MNILLTNDDGIDARGLNVLDRILSQHHSVYVIAPSEEQSGCSNAFTIRRDMFLEKRDDNHFSLSGYPADCVNVGIHGGIIPDFDLVLSGINHGPNLGDDTFFSGTVAGARTARIFNKKGIAVSLDAASPSDKVLTDFSDFLVQFIERNIKIDDTSLFLNINYPDLSQNQIKGIKTAPLSKRIYKDRYVKSNAGNEKIKIRLEGDISAEYQKGTDHEVLKEGYIVMTPLTINNTDYHSMGATGFMS